MQKPLESQLGTLWISILDILNYISTNFQLYIFFPFDNLKKSNDLGLLQMWMSVTWRVHVVATPSAQIGSEATPVNARAASNLKMRRTVNVSTLFSYETQHHYSPIIQAYF